MSPNCSQTKTSAKVIISVLISKKNKKKKVNALTFLHSRPVSAHRGPLYHIIYIEHVQTPSDFIIF